MIRPFALVWLLTLGLLTADAAAQDDPDAARPEIVGIRVGVAGRYRPGLWTPVEVRLRGVSRLRDGRATLTTADGDGVPSRFHAPLPSPTAPRGDAADPETSVLLFARFGRVRSEAAVEVRDGERTVAQRVFRAGDTADYPPALLSDQQLVVTVGRASVGVEQAIRLLREDPGEETIVATIDDLGRLPTKWHGYEGVDTVVLSSSDPTIYAGADSGSPQIAALDTWVRNGGRLVLCIGHQAENVLREQRDAPLAQFVPGRLERMVPLLPSRITALETYCECSVRVPEPRGPTSIPYLTDVEGKIEARDGPVPLVVRAARDFGQVIFLAVDLDREPFADWEDRGVLLRSLLGHPAARGDERDESTAVMHYGFTDMAGQLRSALDQFSSSGVWVVPFWLVVGLIVVYLLAIGPGDYFLLRKLAGRMQLTWITFPLIIAAFSVIAYVLAHHFKGDRICVNQVDLVDVDNQSGRLRGTAWANLFSPQVRRYDLAFRPRLPRGRGGSEAETLTAWLGLPGDALGGMNPRTTEPSIWKGHYDFSHRLDALSGVPIPIWSTKSLTGRWTARVTGGLEVELHEEDRLPVGTLTNRLGFSLSECLLAYGNYAYELGAFESGESVEVGPMLKRLELRSLLTGWQIVFDDEKDDYRSEVTPYDRGSVDVAYILRAMMFFDEAGGRRYTGLTNRYQRFVDLTDLLETNRAVLVGRADRNPSRGEHHGADLLCNGRPLPESQVRHTTFYRFLLAVEEE